MTVDVNALKAQIDELAALAAGAARATDLAQAQTTVENLQSQITELQGALESRQARITELEAQHEQDEALLEQVEARVNALVAVQADPDFQQISNLIGALVMKHRDKLPAGQNGALALWLSPELTQGATQ